MHEAAVKVKQICENFKRRTTDKNFSLTDYTTEKFKIKEFRKKKNQLIKNFEKRKIVHGERVNRRQYHI